MKTREEISLLVNRRETEIVSVLLHADGDAILTVGLVFAGAAFDPPPNTGEVGCSTR
jgi:hypothetical protein